MGHHERGRGSDSDSDSSDSDDNRHGGRKEDKEARKARKKLEKASKNRDDSEERPGKDKKEKKGKQQGRFEQFAVEQPPPIPGQHRDAYPAGMPPSYTNSANFSPGHGPYQAPGGEAASFFASGHSSSNSQSAEFSPGHGAFQVPSGGAASFPGGGHSYSNSQSADFSPGHGAFQVPSGGAAAFVAGGHSSSNEWRGQQQRAFDGRSSPPQPQPTHSPSYPMQTPPPSGVRIPLSTGQPFPPSAQAGAPPFRDLDGSPVYIGSALFENPSAVHPCKIAPNLHPPARVPYGGGEHEHNGRYDLLPFVPEQMEWVHTSGGVIPSGRRPIEGGYENGGGRLFHGYAEIQGIGVPGKVGEHLVSIAMFLWLELF